MLGAHPFHAVGEKYITPLLRTAGALPLLIPSLGEELRLAELLQELDGLLFTGSPSNVEPRHYGGDPSRAGTLHDPERDATTLTLIPRAIAAGVPVLGICRGFQEVNVAMGGTLWQHVHEVPGKAVHHEDATQPLDTQYAPVHAVAHGRVIYANPFGWGQVDRGVIIVRHTFPDGETKLSFYGHVQPETVTLRPGDCVVRGQEIAKVDKPRGRPHLHFEVRDHLPDRPGPMTRPS